MLIYCCKKLLEKECYSMLLTTNLSILIFSERSYCISVLMVELTSMVVINQGEGLSSSRYVCFGDLHSAAVALSGHTPDKNVWLF